MYLYSIVIAHWAKASKQASLSYKTQLCNWPIQIKDATNRKQANARHGFKNIKQSESDNG